MSDAAERREAALDLLARYVRVVDDPARIDEWPELFTDDAEYIVITRENLERGLEIAIIRDDSKDRIIDRLTLIRDFWGAGGREEDRHYNQMRTRHIVGPSWVEPGEGDAVLMGANFMVWASAQVDLSGAPRLTAIGEYRDVVEFSGGTARFRSKTVMLDAPVLQDVFVYPV
jgi:anthranilate 1,2-dioxygenase small subunit